MAAAEAGNVSTTVSGPGGLSFTVNLEVAPPALAIPENPSLDVYGNVWQYAGKTPAKLPQFEAFYQNLWEHRVFTGPDMNEPHAQIWPVSSTLPFFRLLLLPSSNPLQPFPLHNPCHSQTVVVRALRKRAWLGHRTGP